MSEMQHMKRDSLRKLVDAGMLFLLLGPVFYLVMGEEKQEYGQIKYLYS